ncbi:phosphopantetheine-binding protein [Nannocystis sp.]|uniref:phosphopantetheine-binding protein n=1 Tax=Nannocystis sp. TaxID=1962667 RepID=UPI0024267F08|nr:phosphopantetheine-binding protein [Nannocystis sp.]MBK7829403.1 acyl carrier protein [Nannocystis sp.]MBK9753473.1 acyl carrier protein [Nannocystis sp.]
MSTAAAPPAPLVREIKELIIEALMLQDMSPDDIDPEAPLLVEGLGLDSIDVLELAMAINKKYGVKTKADDAQNRHIFASVNNLATFIHEQQAA